MFEISGSSFGLNFAEDDFAVEDRLRTVTLIGVLAFELLEMLSETVPPNEVDFFEIFIFCALFFLATLFCFSLNV